MVQSESVMWSTNVTDIILGLIDYLWLQHDQASSGLIGCVCISFCHLWKAAGFRFPNPITRIIVGYVCVGKQWLCSDFTFILVQLLMLSCHNSVVNGLVRLRHKKHFRVTKTFCWSWRCSNIIFFFFDTNMADVSLKISNSVIPEHVEAELLRDPKWMSVLCACQQIFSVLVSC